jgi:hypothetical protein
MDKVVLLRQMCVQQQSISNLLWNPRYLRKPGILIQLRRSFVFSSREDCCWNSTKGGNVVSKIDLYGSVGDCLYFNDWSCRYCSLERGVDSTVRPVEEWSLTLTAVELLGQRLAELLLQNEKDAANTTSTATKTTTTHNCAVIPTFGPSTWILCILCVPCHRYVDQNNNDDVFLCCTKHTININFQY